MSEEKRKPISIQEMAVIIKDIVSKFSNHNNTLIQTETHPEGMRLSIFRYSDEYMSKTPKETIKELPKFSLDKFFEMRKKVDPSVFQKEYLGEWKDSEQPIWYSTKQIQESPNMMNELIQGSKRYDKPAQINVDANYDDSHLKPLNEMDSIDDLVNEIEVRFSGMEEFLLHPEDGFIGLCNSFLATGCIGQVIRNEMQLWQGYGMDDNNDEGERPKAYSLLKEKGFDHPDEMSTYLLRQVHSKMNKNNIKVNTYRLIIDALERMSFDTSCNGLIHFLSPKAIYKNDKELFDMIDNLKLQGLVK